MINIYASCNDYNNDHWNDTHLEPSTQHLLSCFQYDFQSPLQECEWSFKVHIYLTVVCQQITHRSYPKSTLTTMCIITKNLSCGTMGRTTHSRTYSMQPLTEAFQTCTPGGLYQNLCMQFCVLSGNIILKIFFFKLKAGFTALVIFVQSYFQSTPLHSHSIRQK